MIDSYRLSTYDPGAGPEDAWGWNVRASGLSLWGLRAALREARGMGYEDDLSILVEREAEKPLLPPLPPMRDGRAPRPPRVPRKRRGGKG